MQINENIKNGHGMQLPKNENELQAICVTIVLDWLFFDLVRKDKLSRITLGKKIRATKKIFSPDIIYAN